MFQIIVRDEPNQFRVTSMVSIIRLVQNNCNATERYD